MPWKSSEAKSHTHKAKSAVAQRQWKDVANSMLKEGKSEASAIKAANAAVAKRKHKS
jgi:uncharacterized protein YdaT